DRADPAADAERDAERFGDAAGELDDCAPSFHGRRDVEEDELVGAFEVISRRERDWVARIAQANEPRALDHATVLYVEARDDPLREHRAPLEVARPNERRALVPLAALSYGSLWSADHH